MTYAEKLKDPRWQKKRLKILERDDWECQICGEKKETLNVHHRDYSPGKEPWDAPDNFLTTLCEGCHEIETEMLPIQVHDISKVAKQVLFSEEIWNLTSGLIRSPEKIKFEDTLIIKAFLVNKEFKNDCRALYKKHGEMRKIR